MGACQRTALMIKESRGEEGLGSAGSLGSAGRVAVLGRRRSCVLSGQRRAKENMETMQSQGWGGEAVGGDRDSVKSHQIRPVGGA